MHVGPHRGEPATKPCRLRASGPAGASEAAPAGPARFEGDPMETLEAILSRASAIVWGTPLLVLLFGTHLFLTVRLRFVQRYLGRAIRLSLERRAEGAGDVSHFGALATALAATIGTGNIVGVPRPSPRAAPARCSGCGSRGCSGSPPSTRRPFSP